VNHVIDPEALPRILDLIAALALVLFVGFLIASLFV